MQDMGEFRGTLSFNMRATVKSERPPFEIVADVHEIKGGGYWAEVPRFPGCVAQAETIEALKQSIVHAVGDWLTGTPDILISENQAVTGEQNVPTSPSSSETAL